MLDPIHAAWFLFLTFNGAADLAQQSHFIDSAQQLRVGMTPTEVVDVMGPPTGGFEAKSLTALALLKFQPKHWFYGITYDIRKMVVPGWPFPNPIPIHLRFFTYAEDDVVVRWSFDEQVVEITRPEPLDAPTEFQQILEVRRLFQDIAAIVWNAAAK